MKKVVLTVLLLIAVMIFGGCLGSLANRPAQERLHALQAAKHLALACHLYAQDNDGMLPTSTTLLMPYVETGYDPEDFVMVAIGKLSEIKHPDTVVLLKKKVPLAHGEQAVAFVDGHAEIVSGG